MTPAVTRSTIWFKPLYVELEIKGLTTFTYFSKSLVFYTPTHKTAIWRGLTPKQAKEDGMDLAVRPWSWWLILDGITEISCTYSGTYGQPVVRWFNGHEGSEQTMPVTNAEATEIYNAVRAMMTDAVWTATRLHKVDKTNGLFKKGPKGLLTPGGSAMKYRAQGLEYKHNGSAPVPACPVKFDWAT